MTGRIDIKSAFYFMVNAPLGNESTSLYALYETTKDEDRAALIQSLSSEQFVSLTSIIIRRAYSTPLRFEEWRRRHLFFSIDTLIGAYLEEATDLGDKLEKIHILTTHCASLAPHSKKKIYLTPECLRQESWHLKKAPEHLQIYLCIASAYDALVSQELSLQEKELRLKSLLDYLNLSSKVPSYQIFATHLATLCLTDSQIPSSLLPVVVRGFCIPSMLSQSLLIPFLSKILECNHLEKMMATLLAYWPIWEQFEGILPGTLAELLPKINTVEKFKVVYMTMIMAKAPNQKGVQKLFLDGKRHCHHLGLWRHYALPWKRDEIENLISSVEEEERKFFCSELPFPDN